MLILDEDYDRGREVTCLLVDELMRLCSQCSTSLSSPQDRPLVAAFSPWLEGARSNIDAGSDERHEHLVVTR